MQKGNRALDHKCPACRAVIEFKPKLGKWKCDYCDNEYDLEELQKFNNASSKSVNEGALGDDTIYDSYRCKNCGCEQLNKAGQEFIKEMNKVEVE